MLGTTYSCKSPFWCASAPSSRYQERTKTGFFCGESWWMEDGRDSLELISLACLLPRAVRFRSISPPRFVVQRSTAAALDCFISHVLKTGAAL